MRILIVKTSALGDIVQAFPILDYLSKKFSNLAIDWVVEKQLTSLVTSHPLIRRTIPISTKEWRKSYFQQETRADIRKTICALQAEKYDLLFDLQGNIKSGIISYVSHAKEKVGYSWKSAPEWANGLFTTKKVAVDKRKPIQEQYLSLIQNYFEDKEPFSWENYPLLLAEEDKASLQDIEDILSTEDAPYKILIAPHSFWANKKIGTEVWVEFLNLISEKFSVWFGLIAGSEQEQGENLNILNQIKAPGACLPKTSLNTLQHIYNLFNGLISVDSMPLHLGATTSIPIFSVFGPSSNSIYAPLGNDHFSIQGSCPYGKTFIKRCPLLRKCPTGACIKNITSAQLFDLFSAWWEKQFIEKKLLDI